LIELKKYIELIESHLSEFVDEPANHKLFDPVHHILSIGGKRLRPALCLMTCDLLEGNILEALPAAMSIELFHNFSLLHDDIMDQAPLRRGKETAHIKWNTNQAILSGDALFVMASRSLEYSKDEHLKDLLQIFNQTSMEVCIGQQLDMDFEKRNDVSVDEYLQMIELKTSVLLGASFKMGAICANASNNDLEALYNFGVNLGLAFQLRDDYLDAFPSSIDFGKQIGGDILADKKTYLYIRALQMSDASDQDMISKHLGKTSEGKVEDILKIYEKLNLKSELEKLIEEYSEAALINLNESSLNAEAEQPLRNVVKHLMSRDV
jgi:geranylgeranyl diphosphate synthase type II